MPTTTQYVFTGSSAKLLGRSVTMEFYPGGFNAWVLTMWEQGLPIERKPVTSAKAKELLARYPHSSRTY